jgi:hypothetical protein
LTGHFTGRVQLIWLNVYYTAICLLLCWQYYRLARAVGLGKQTSFSFVLLQALLFGNNIFSFYRYYGLSSSIVTQLAAVALVRGAVEVFTLPASRTEKIHAQPSASGLPQRLVCGLAIALLIVATHVQGLGIAGLGVAGVIIWHLVKSRRANLLWLAMAAIALSATLVNFYPLHPLLAGAYRSEGWLSSWYGFKLWDPSSPAFDRAFQIFGLFGLVNLGAGLILLRRNSLVGWLTVAPPLLLTLPVVAIPLADALTTNTVLTFHRMVFAVPTGLAVISLLDLARRHGRRRWAAGLPLVISLATLIPSESGYNRVWHALAQTPKDQSLQPILRQVAELDLRAYNDGRVYISSNDSTRDVLMSMYPLNERNPVRGTNQSLVIMAENLREEISYVHSLDGKFAVETGNDTAHQSRRHHVVYRSLKQEEPLQMLSDGKGDWITLNDQPPTITIDPVTGQETISNPPGLASYAFIRSPIPISLNRRYRISIQMQAASDVVSSNYLALAWYNGDGEFINLSDSSSADAAGPRGWANGSFSYFGIVSAMPPGTWREYSVVFGFGVRAQIPHNARSIRVGALLNQNGAAAAVTQITGLSVQELPSPKRLVALTSNPRDYYTPSSLAGTLSNHWSAQHLSVCLMGSQELETAWTAALGDKVAPTKTATRVPVP